MFIQVIKIFFLQFFFMSMVARYSKFIGISLYSGFYCLRLWMSFFSWSSSPSLLFFPSSFSSSTVHIKSKHQLLASSSVISMFSSLLVLIRKPSFPKLTLPLMSSHTVVLLSLPHLSSSWALSRTYILLVPLCLFQTIFPPFLQNNFSSE